MSTIRNENENVVTGEPTPAEAIRAHARSNGRVPRHRAAPAAKPAQPPTETAQPPTETAPSTPTRNEEPLTVPDAPARPSRPAEDAPPSAVNFQPTADPRVAAALKAKQRHLMESFCDMLYYRIQDTILSTKGSVLNIIGTFTLPTTENRARDVHRCYWAGKGDVRTEGTPIVQLLQGVRDHKTGKVHPEWLWGGQTAIDNMNEWFSKDDWLVHNHFNAERKEFQVYLVDRKATHWERELAELTTPRPRRNQSHYQPPRK